MNVMDVAAVFLVVDFAEAAEPHHFRETHDGIERGPQLMADAGEEFRFLAACRLGTFLGLAQFRLGFLPLRDVADDRAEGCLRPRGLQLADRQEQRHRSPLADDCRDLTPVVEDGCEAGALKCCQIIADRLAAFRRQQVDEGLSRHIGDAVAEDRLRPCAEGVDARVRIECDDAVGGGIENGAQFLVIRAAAAGEAQAGQEALPPQCAPSVPRVQPR
jgi:hypothetical protein